MAHEIRQGLDLAQSTVSEHRRGNAHVLSVTRDGPRTWYCRRRSVLRRFADAVAELADERSLRVAAS